MPSIIQRLIGAFSKVTAGGASASMIALFLIVFFNSVRRYLFGKSFEWGEEFPVYITIYGVMFGMAWAYLRDRHIRFTMLVGFIPESWTRRLYILVDLIMVVNGVMLTYSGWMFVARRGGLEASGIINMAKSLRAMTGMKGMIWIGHMYPYQAAIMIGGVMLAIAAMLKLVSRFYAEPELETAGG